MNGSICLCLDNVVLHFDLFHYRMPNAICPFQMDPDLQGKDFFLLSPPPAFLKILCLFGQKLMNCKEVILLMDSLCYNI